MRISYARLPYICRMAYRLHREGRKILPIAFLLIGALLALIYFLLSGSAWIWLAHLLALGGLVLFGLIVNFFRNPEVQVSRNDQHVLCPCDGKVVVIEEVLDTVYFHDKVLQISVFMSPLNVHVNRNPIGGEVKFCEYYPGKFLVAFDPKSSELNERTYVVTDNGRVQIGYKQIAGYVARRICCYIKKGDRVQQGEEYGFIRFGSRIDILLPLTAAVKVKLGDITKAGVTVLAEI